jgi:hypothetical protein
MNDADALKIALSLRTKLAHFKDPSLSLDLLHDEASKISGLYDFGDSHYLEGLQVLLRCMSHDAKITPSGKQRFYQNLIRLLTNRLLIEAYYQKYAEISAQPIAAPIFITGLPRSGTSFVQQLLALEPRAKYLCAWECDMPCPPPQLVFNVADPRIALYQRMADLGKQLAPELHTAHPLDAGRPEECQQLLAMDFKSSSFMVFYHLPEYQEWLLGCDMTSAYAYHQRILKLLQWKNPNGRWVLKAPMHMQSLALIHTMYPDTKFIICQRDIESVLASNVKVAYHAQRMAYAEPNKAAITHAIAYRLDRYTGLAGEARGLIPQTAVFALDYAALVENPVRELYKILEFVGVEQSVAFESRVAAWLK